jgi:hypothetical protein
LKEVTMDIRLSGFDIAQPDVAAWGSVATAAQGAGLSPTLTSVLADETQPVVARVRAYAILGRQLTFAR